MNWINILVRSIILFFVTLALCRITGQRHPAKMTPFQFVHYTVIAILAALISVNLISNLAFGITSLVIWGLFPIGLDYLGRNKKLYDFLNGKETVLVKEGKVLENNLKSIRFTSQDLLRELRTKNVFNLADVEFAVMETTGDLNVVLKSDKKPVTAHDLGQKVAPQVEPQTVILDGEIQDESLTNLGFTRAWLNAQLESAGLLLHNVFIGQADASGDLYVDLFDDKIQTPQPKVKELIYANLEKCCADLESFALDSENPKAQAMYSNNANQLRAVLNKLEPYLLR